MKNTIVCPHCKGVLNPNVKVVLVGATKNVRGLMLLSPQPGNYRFLCDKTLEEALRPGDTIEYSCPLCGKGMTADNNKKLTRMELHAPGHDPRRVEFSCVFGTNATFIIDGNDVTSYGDDADDFGSTNFFGS